MGVQIRSSSSRTRTDPDAATAAIGGINRKICFVPADSVAGMTWHS